MKRVTREWIRKAEADFSAAQRESRARNRDLACFLAQQCLEKYLKAVLEERSLPFPRTHDLGYLGGLALASCPDLKPHLPALRRVSTYAVMFRYPGASATPAQARSAAQLMLAARVVLRAALGLDRNRG